MLFLEGRFAEALQMEDYHVNLLILFLNELLLVVRGKRGDTCKVVLWVSIQQYVKTFASYLLNLLFESLLIFIEPLGVFFEVLLEFEILCNDGCI